MATTETLTPPRPWKQMKNAQPPPSACAGGGLLTRIPTMATTETLTPSRLWKQMNSAQRLASARAFWADDDAIDDQVQAALLIAQQKKFRPKTVIGLDLDRKSKHLASL